jgi:hypothetical protein
MTGLPLECAEAHADIPPNRRIFAPFIGAWDLDVTWYEDGARARREPGEWHFAWVLEGRAVQDVWIVPPRKSRSRSAQLYEYGTSLRFYDPKIDAWRSTWIGPMTGAVYTFVARGDHQRVTLESTADATKARRWIFSDIGAESFKWENFEQSEGGAWLLVQDFAARRAHALD